MSLGISATAWAGVGSAALGAITGGSGSGSSNTQQNSVDPRFGKYIYGDGSAGNGGILGNASDWYNANKSGMNDPMRQGLNSQYGVLNDPATMGGYRQMGNLGSGLMSAPVMGNPFADGRMTLNQGRGAPASSANLGMGQPQQPPAPPPQSYTLQGAMPPQNPGAPSAPMPGPFTAPPPQAAAPAVAAPAQAPGFDDRYGGPPPAGYKSWDDYWAQALQGTGGA